MVFSNLGKWNIITRIKGFSSLYYHDHLYRSVKFSTKNNGISSDTLQDLAHHIKEKCSNILVMTGAGLSTHSGIPDFRSPNTGLYYNLKEYKLPYAEAIFDLNYFAADPRPFLTLARELYPGGKYRPNIGHYLVRLLQEKNKLLRMYTQNIDGLERMSGILEENLVEAHGGFNTASCIKCRTIHDPGNTRERIMKGEVVRCSKEKCKGLVKPDVVFFGEMLPARFSLHENDTHLADLLIVIGTTLEVYPFASIADAVHYDIPRLLLNRNVVGNLGQRGHDAILPGDIIEGVMTLAKSLGWEKELVDLYNKHENQRLL